MWKHGACLDVFQQDANVSKCDDLNQHDVLEHINELGKSKKYYDYKCNKWSNSVIFMGILFMRRSLKKIAIHMDLCGKHALVCFNNHIIYIYL
jgi:hypothetical protein